MPVPAIIGLAALGSAITTVIGKAVVMLFSKTAKKIAVFGVVIAGIYAAIMGIFTFVGSQLRPLINSLPPDIVSLLGAALPSNTSTCLAAVAATQVACMTYKLTIKALETQAQVAS